MLSTMMSLIRVPFSCVFKFIQNTQEEIIEFVKIGTQEPKKKNLE